MNLKSCECGVVLDLDSDIELKEDEIHQLYYYTCPVCKREIEAE